MRLLETQEQPADDKNTRNDDKTVSDDGNAGKGKNKMTKTMKIEGMMCGHCEATVKKALEAVEGDESAAVSHQNGTAVVTCAENVSESVLKEAVEAKDYTVTGIE